MVQKTTWLGIVTAIIFVLAVCAIIVSYDRRHLQLTEGNLLHGTVLSVHLGEPEVGAFTDEVIVRMDDGRTLHTGSTKMPIVEGCRVTLQGGRTRLLGFQEFRIITIERNGEQQSGGYSPPAVRSSKPTL